MVSLNSVVMDVLVRSAYNFLEIELISIKKLNLDYLCSVKIGRVNLADEELCNYLITADEIEKELPIKDIYVKEPNFIFNDENKIVYMSVSDIGIMTPIPEYSIQQKEES